MADRLVEESEQERKRVVQSETRKLVVVKRPSHAQRLRESMNVTWKDAKSFKDMLIEAIQNSTMEELVPLLKILPPEKKAFYRKLYKEEIEKRKACKKKSTD